MLSINQRSIKFHFWVFGKSRPRIEALSPGLLLNTLLTRPMGGSAHVLVCTIWRHRCIFSISRHIHSFMFLCAYVSLSVSPILFLSLSLSLSIFIYLGSKRKKEGDKVKGRETAGERKRECNNEIDRQTHTQMCARARVCVCVCVKSLETPPVPALTFDSWKWPCICRLSEGHLFTQVATRAALLPVKLFSLTQSFLVSHIRLWWTFNWQRWTTDRTKGPDRGILFLAFSFLFLFGIFSFGLKRQQNNIVGDTHA